MEHSVINVTISRSDGEEIMLNVFNNKAGSSSIKKTNTVNERKVTKFICNW